MTQDLEAAKTPNVNPFDPFNSVQGRPESNRMGDTAQGKPVSRPIAMPQPNGRKLSEILTQAQNRVQTPSYAKASEGKPPLQRPPTENLEEILPIEPLDPFNSVQGRPESNRMGDKLRASPFGKAVGGQFPSSTPTALREPPINLPTGLPEQTQVRKREELPASPTGEPASPSQSGLQPRVGEPPKPSVAPSPDVKRKALSPEEILGLTAPKPPKTNFFGPTPAKGMLPAESPSIAPNPKKNLISKKFVFIAGVLGITLIAIAGGVYWKVSRPETLPETPIEIVPEPKINEQPMPEALISYGAIEVVEIDKISYSSLRPKLDTLKNIPFPAEFLIYTPVRLKTDSEITYLTLQEFFAGLQINAPENLIAQINEDFSLFLYSQEEAAERLCIDAEILDEQCYGPRLGLVIGISDPDRTFSIMRAWEKTMIEDLRPILFYDPQEKPGGSFKAGEYKSLKTNFINLPIPTMSIDWIIADNHLIIATSKEAARKVADRLK